MFVQFGSGLNSPVSRREVRLGNKGKSSGSQKAKIKINENNNNKI
jgi:hypothetical protein